MYFQRKYTQISNFDCRQMQNVRYDIIVLYLNLFRKYVISFDVLNDLNLMYSMTLIDEIE